MTSEHERGHMPDLGRKRDRVAILKLSPNVLDVRIHLCLMILYCKRHPRPIPFLVLHSPAALVGKVMLSS